MLGIVILMQYDSEAGLLASGTVAFKMKAMLSLVEKSCVILSYYIQHSFQTEICAVIG